MISVFLIARHKYSFKLESHMIQLFVVFVLLTGLVVGVSYINNTLIRYVIGILLIIISSTYSLYKMNKYMDVKSIIMSKIHKWYL